MKTEIKTELKSKKHLTKALTSLGFTYTEAAEGQKLVTKGRYSVHEDVDIVVNGNGKVNYDAAVGFRKQADGTYMAVGDFYGLRTADGKSVSAEMLKCEVTSHAKEIEVNERLSALMFQMEDGTRKETNQEISFTLQRWVN
jgi:hypothetical protein